MEQHGFRLGGPELWGVLVGRREKERMAAHWQCSGFVGFWGGVPHHRGRRN